MNSTSQVRTLVLYVRSDALGDGLMRIPALRAARDAFGDARIIYGVNGTTTLASTLRRHVEAEVDEFRPGQTLSEILAELEPARGTTAIVDMRTVVGWVALERLRLLPRGYVFEGNFPGHALSWARRGFGVRPEHNARRYHRLIERLAGRPLPFDHRLAVLDAARAQAARLRGDHLRPLILIGANSAPHKALGADQLVPVAQEMLQRGYQVLYVNTPGSGPGGAELVARVPGLGSVGPGDDFDGLPLLEVLLALGATADAYIGPEGGLGHWLASALTPMVLVNYGANMDRWRPLSPLVEVVDARTASPSGRPPDAPPAAILQAIDRLLAARRRSTPLIAGT